MAEPDQILDNAASAKELVDNNIRDAADWFHQNIGELFERDEAIQSIEQELDVAPHIARGIIEGLVGDTVDPVVQVPTHDGRYVGIIEYNEYDGAYGYVDYHDVRGDQKRVVCAQCVKEATYDSEVTHATSGDPEGSFSKDASFEELVDAIHEHYQGSHDEKPEEVETGASLVSGTTIGGNIAWQDGNVSAGTDIGISSRTVNVTGPPSNLSAYPIPNGDISALTNFSSGDQFASYPLASSDIGNGVVTSGKIANNAVVNGKVATSAVSANNLTPNAAGGGGGQAVRGMLKQLKGTSWTQSNVNGTYHRTISTTISGVDVRKWRLHASLSPGRGGGTIQVSIKTDNRVLSIKTNTSHNTEAINISTTLTFNGSNHVICRAGGVNITGSQRFNFQQSISAHY